MEQKQKFWHKNKSCDTKTKVVVQKETLSCLRLSLSCLTPDSADNFKGNVELISKHLIIMNLQDAWRACCKTVYEPVVSVSFDSVTLTSGDGKCGDYQDTPVLVVSFDPVVLASADAYKGNKHFVVV